MELNKKNILFLFIILLFFCFDNNITALEIRIDLSAMDGSASGNWNTISLANANLTTSNLKNYTDGAASSISITGSGWNGEWHGTIPAGYWFDGGAGMGDRLYCSTGSASFTFSNLGTSTYSVEILSEGDATVNYLTVNSSSASRSNLGNTVYPWNQGNSNDWLIWDSVTPSAGQITISISVQSGTYLNMDLIRIVQLITAPAAPTSNAASNISPTSFLANWNTVGDATGYKLDVSTVNTFASFVTGYQDLNVGKVTSYRVSGLNASTTYYYRVRAYNTVGTSANSGTQSTATTTAATEKQEFTYTGSDQTWTAPANVRQVYVQAWGAGGGKSGYSTSYAGGSGGYSSGTVPVSPGQTYTIVVGQGGIGLGVGSGGTAGGSATYGGGGYGTMGDASGASGGGLSGFFMGNSGMTFDASGQARAFIIAGGGGGSTGYAGGAGAGGGTTGGAGAATGGNGGTQSAGGTGTAGADGSALCGGNGSSTGFQASGSSDGGGGGGGYWGGEGGYDDAKPGGGGSGYLHGTIIGGQTTQGTQGPTSSEATPPNTGNSDYLSTAGVGAYGQVSTASGANGGHGLVVLSWTPKIIDQNLLTNAGAESGTLDSWTIIENGGNGWTVYENGIGGNYLFATSHLWCKKSQTIDLIAKGYTAAELDSVPKIYVEC
nr:fibronectin type III domain-containing protein [Candidatus Dependentiae bacterium]